MIKLAVLGSTRGTHLQTLIDAIESRRLQASIEIVLSNKSDALILDKAKAQGLNYQFLDPKDWAKQEYDQQINRLLKRYAVDLVVLVGYMRILSVEFVRGWQNKIINVHPSLLPAFAGKMDKSVHQAVLESGLKETGCTIHYVTAQVDAGPILLQKTCPVLATDNADLLKNRVQKLEGEALIEVINGLVASMQCTKLS